MPFSLPSSSQSFLLKSKNVTTSSAAANALAASSSSKTKSPSSLFSFKAAAEKASDRFRSKKSKESKKTSSYNSKEAPSSLQENHINEIVKIETKSNKLAENSVQTKSTPHISSLDKKSKFKSISKNKAKKSEAVNTKKLSKKSSPKKDSIESSSGSCVSSVSSSNNTNSVSTKSKKSKPKSKRVNLLVSKIDEEESDSHQETDETHSDLPYKKKLNKKVKSEDEYNFNDVTVGTNEDDEANFSDRDIFEESYTDQIIEEEEEEDEENEDHLANGKFYLLRNIWPC